MNSQTRAWAATRRSCRHERAHTTCPTCTSVAGCEPQTPCVACAPDAARAVGVTSHQTCTSDATGLFRSILFAYALYLAYKMIRRLLKPQVVRLLFKDTQRNRRLLAKCPSLAKYAPTPWLMVRTDTSWPAARFLAGWVPALTCLVPCLPPSERPLADAVRCGLPQAAGLGELHAHVRGPGRWRSRRLGLARSVSPRPADGARAAWADRWLG